MVKNLLIIGLHFPESQSTAAGSRMMQLIALFSSKEFIIHFASSIPKHQLSDNLKPYHVQEHHIELNSSHVEELFKSINPDAVLFDRFITEEQFGWRIDECCPHALKILDTEDLHFLREQRENAVLKPEHSHENQLADKAKRELASIYRCDVSLIISKAELKLLNKTSDIPKSLLYYLPFMVDTSLIEKKKTPSFKERKHIVSIGNFKHKPNLDMVLYFYNHIWERIRNEQPKIEWHIYGAYLPQQVEQLHNPKKGIIVKGRAEHAITTLSHYRLMLAPLRFGAGLKGKLIDAMLSGTPSITTKIGAEGISKSKKWPGKIAHSPSDFVQATTELYHNKELWQDKQNLGYDVLENNFNEKHLGMNFIRHVSFLLDKLIEHRQNNTIGQLLRYHHHRSTKFMSLWIEEKNKKSIG